MTSITALDRPEDDRQVLRLEAEAGRAAADRASRQQRRAWPGARPTRKLEEVVAMIFRDTTWKGARVEEGSTWRNSVALYQVVHEGPYHKPSRRFSFTGRMLCGEPTHGVPSDYVRVSRDHLDRWPVCPECAAHKGF